MNFDRELLSNALPAYDIGEELGQGGMGIVVSGQHRQLGRRVAIKQLPEAFATDPAVRRRFTAEAQVLASLDHPHVVPVYDFVEREGVCLLVMELLPGGTLRSRVDAGGCAAPYAVAVSLACLSGLSAAHRRGILHRLASSFPKRWRSDSSSSKRSLANAAARKRLSRSVAAARWNCGTRLTR